MKRQSLFSVPKKMLLVIATLLCASELGVARSVLNQERNAVDAWQAEIFGEDYFVSGALTLDSLLGFEFGNAGMGRVILRQTSKSLYLAVDQDSPRSVGRWNVAPEPNSFISPNFASLSSSFTSGGGASPLFDDQSSDPSVPLAPVPEPSTWFGAALALIAIGFTQRQRLRGLVARRA